MNNGDDHYNVQHYSVDYDRVRSDDDDKKDVKKEKEKEMKRDPDD